MTRRRDRNITPTMDAPSIPDQSVVPSPRKMKAKVFMLGIANKGDSLEEVGDYTNTIGTLGNKTDVVVKNQHGGHSIISVENVVFEDEGVVDESTKDSESESDENITQDEIPEENELEE